MIRYRSKRPADTGLRERLRKLACKRRRFGYRRLFVLLRRAGEPSGISRIYRLYREEGLSVRKRRARRKATGTRAPIPVEARPNARWLIDFVHDQFACGRRFRILNIVDDVPNATGVDQHRDVMGATAIDVLNSLLQRNQRGEDTVSIGTQIDGSWRKGNSLPSIPANSQKARSGTPVRY